MFDNDGDLMSWENRFGFIEGLRNVINDLIVSDDINTHLSIKRVIVQGNGPVAKELDRLITKHITMFKIRNAVRLDDKNKILTQIVTTNLTFRLDFKDIIIKALKRDNTFKECINSCGMGVNILYRESANNTDIDEIFHWLIEEAYNEAARELKEM